MINKGELKEIENASGSRIKEPADLSYVLEQSCIVAITDAQGVISYANDNFCRISKYTLTELIGQDHRLLNGGFHSKDFFATLWSTIAGGKIWRGEIKNRAKDGVWYWIDTTIVPFLNEQGKPYQYIACSVDITVRKEFKETLKKVTRLYSFISQVNQDIVHEKEEQSLFRNACRIAFEFGKFRIAWIGLFDREGTKISCINQMGIPAEILDQFYNVLLKADGPQSYVLQTGLNYICNNIVNKPELADWKALAASQKVCSCMILPIRKAGNIIGTFNLYAEENDFFYNEEIKLLEEVTRDISFALDKFEIEKAHKETEELVIINENRYRALVEHGADAVIILTTEGRPFYVSPTVEKVLGYTKAEVTGFDLLSLLHPDDLTGVSKVWEQVLLNPAMSTAVNAYRLMHKDGTWHWFEGTLTNLLNDPHVNGVINNFRDVTEKKLAEESLLLTQFAIDSAGDAVFWMTPNARIVKVNEAASEMLGYTQQEMLELSVPDIDPHYDVEKWPDHFAELRRKGSIFFETVQRTKDGRLIPVEIRANYIKFGDSEFNCAFSRDISERKIAETTLKQSEKRLKDAQSIANLGHWILDFTTGIATWSEEACKIYGFPIEENKHTYENWLSYIHPEDTDYVLDAIKANQSFSDQVLKHRIVLKDGTVKHLISTSRFELDTNGKPIGIYGIARDVTAAKIAEDNLAHSESRLKEAQAIAHIGNFEIDAKNYSEVWSDEMYRIYGLTKGEVVPSKELFLSLIHPDDLAYMIESMENSIRTFENWSNNFRFIRRDGVLRYGYAEARFEADKNNVLTRIYGIIQDVTESKLAEIERTKMLNDLMLRNNDLEQFAYIISHNLRAPLANIIGASNALTDPDLTIDEKEMLNSGISKCVIKLDNVVQDLNDILEVKADVNKYKEIVDLSELVEEIKISIQNLINNYPIEIKYEFQAINKVLTLKPYLYSIFYNLILNSIKYRRVDTNTLIEIESRLENNKLELIFRDNGTGIDLERNGKDIFGLYKRFHNNIEGKGMGLFMVKTQVEALGGRIGLKSTQNAGSEFKIVLEV
ncbi:PAS domain-containing protein [Mucilaginibacter sp. UR6-11]|uniref:PAS domain-containing protein n=1 Tax=Mucilaginibacter sp. UR6-11 TaxID=1435644 RepID=UPI001E3A0830|nr:PAS domain-containing protein [Mucilaginibacter sp. UR6-11]MCC8426393.1 PAS domain-containing protein [Mucilaginibacter sp. UR6-11]